jgi:2-amino-4-hydroxy-6-hydroxymethyldihydropteridine diphosphokinase
VLAYIGLGSNLGEGKRILLDAWQMLGEIEGIFCERLSSPYLSAPVGMISRHWFTNAVGRLQTTLAPEDLLQTMLAIETANGRERQGGTGYQDRSLDLDLLYYDKLQLESASLTLPHPRRRERLFVLLPLEEVEPGFVDIESGASIVAMVSALRQVLSEGQSNEQEIVKTLWDRDDDGAPLPRESSL